MKPLILAVLFLGLAGGTWSWVAPDNTGKASEPAYFVDAQEQAGLRRMLSGHRNLALFDLVIAAPIESGTRDFRARFQKDGHTRPVYGRAKRLCKDGPEAAECWEISLFEIDGQQSLATVTQSIETVPMAELENSREEIATDTEALIETADADAQNYGFLVAKEPALGPRSIVDREPAAQLSQAATHLVNRPIINARDGPSTDNKVIAKLSNGVHLSLLKAKNGWGRFVVLDGQAKDQEIWAALRILKDLR